jgi:putative heme-binding domain-containing protein
MLTITSKKARAGLILCVLGICTLLWITLTGETRPGAGQAAEKPVRKEPAKGKRPYGIPQRIPWATSRITGAPEPPHPYLIERAFPKRLFKNPLLITNAPGTDRLFVGEHAGKIYSFKNDPSAAKADPFLDLTTELHNWDKKRVKGVGAVYALTFHPKFAKNRYCYICYVLDSKGGEQLPEGSRVSRFRVSDTEPPRCDPKSEQIIITWLAGGHNGCDLKFGPDGYLYIATGDGSSPNPPDALDTGQDISDLLSSILRIDVDHRDKGKAYAIPADNPFLKTPKARPEVWAYGFRNPWRMSFDRRTGDLWVGDVGWELWEMVYHVRRGGNYGWSVMEGRQPVRPESKRGPTPILPPALDFPHSEAASITGGFVYRGKRLKELVGTYICGDWVTRKVWGTRFEPTGKGGKTKQGKGSNGSQAEGDKIVWHKELAQGVQRIVGFTEDNKGELYFLDYDEKGAIYQLTPNPEAKKRRAPFPRTLSATGLFGRVKDHALAPGVVPFSVNVQQWADHATAERFVGLPGRRGVKMYDRAIAIPGGFYSGQVFFPKDGVLARTVSLEMERGNPRSRRHLETQILHYDGTLWRGYTYAWNEAQTDATLVGPAGMDRTLTVIDKKAPGGKRQQHLRFHSRAECLQCHNPWAGPPLAFTPAQLDKDHRYGTTTDNQLRALHHAGLLEFFHKDDESEKTTAIAELPTARLTDPYYSRAEINARARSYLHVNCSHCHQFGAGGSVDLSLRADAALDETKTLEVRPVQGTFEIPNAHILSPGDPYRSTLYYRMAKLGRGRMPHIGSEIIDDRGLRLIHDWIRQLPIRKETRTLVNRLRALDEPAVLAGELAGQAKRLQWLAQTIAREHNRENVNPADRQEAAKREKSDAPKRAKNRATERRETIHKLLSSTPGALILAKAMAEGRVPASIRPQVLAAATAQTNSQVRDLFERFLPDDQRIKRLGTSFKPQDLLALKGNAAQGRTLFFKSTALQCVNCHRVATQGCTLGPDLSQIGKKYTKAQILAKLLEPSKSIDPKYTLYLVETTDGKFHTGLLAAKSGKEVVLKMAGDKEVRVPVAQVASLAPQRQSLMPEQMLRDLTAEQAADLLAFLAGLK